MQDLASTLSAHPTGRSDAECADDWQTCMRRGDFEQAWQISDALMTVRNRAPYVQRERHQQPIWNGTPLAGRRVLVRCHHGLGDTLQFARYLPLLGAVAGRVAVLAQPGLLPLLCGVPGVDEWLPLDDGPGPDRHAFDVDVEIMELAHVFRTTLATIPPPLPCLAKWGDSSFRTTLQTDARVHSDGAFAPERVHPAAGFLPAPVTTTNGPFSPPPLVGVVWRAGDWDDLRSLPFALLRRLIGEVPGVDWLALQYGLREGERTAPFRCLPEPRTVTDTARQVRACDLVISVDTVTAHLAGSLDVPVWILLRARADWRWLEDRHDSPWYPAMRLFRQPRPGAWTPVIAAVATALTAKLAATPATRPGGRTG